MLSAMATPPDGPAPGPRAIWAPWRLPYLEDVGAQERAGGPPTASTGSFLRDAWLDPARDRENHVVVRGRVGLIMLNRYPYANGHLLVALGEARPTLLDYDPAQRADLWLLTDCATDLVQRALEPQGINIGVNQGRSAGAGVPQHLHVHLVPRWSGDVNFMSVVGQVRVIPAALDDMADRFRKAWAALSGAWTSVR
ncbi:MAG: HIT domain-containing protein [Phycisphaerae bacterium]|nr:HIT domain-containing protein [Phycisphaerae bacterium]